MIIPQNIKLGIKNVDKVTNIYIGINICLYYLKNNNKMHSFNVKLTNTNNIVL